MTRLFFVFRRTPNPTHEPTMPARLHRTPDARPAAPAAEAGLGSSCAVSRIMGAGVFGIARRGNEFGGQGRSGKDGYEQRGRIVARA